MTNVPQTKTTANTITGNQCFPKDNKRKYHRCLPPPNDHCALKFFSNMKWVSIWLPCWRIQWKMQSIGALNFTLFMPQILTDRVSSFGTARDNLWHCSSSSYGQNSFTIDRKAASHSRNITWHVARPQTNSTTQDLLCSVSASTAVNAYNILWNETFSSSISSLVIESTFCSRIVTLYLGLTTSSMSFIVRVMPYGASIQISKVVQTIKIGILFGQSSRCAFLQAVSMFNTVMLVCIGILRSSWKFAKCFRTVWRNLLKFATASLNAKRCTTCVYHSGLFDASKLICWLTRASFYAFSFA